MAAASGVAEPLQALRNSASAISTGMFRQLFIFISFSFHHNADDYNKKRKPRGGPHGYGIPASFYVIRPQNNITPPGTWLHLRLHCGRRRGRGPAPAGNLSRTAGCDIRPDCPICQAFLDFIHFHSYPAGDLVSQIMKRSITDMPGELAPGEIPIAGSFDQSKDTLSD